MVIKTTPCYKSSLRVCEAIPCLTPLLRGIPRKLGINSAIPLSFHLRLLRSTPFRLSADRQARNDSAESVIARDEAIPYPESSLRSCHPALDAGSRVR